MGINNKQRIELNELNPLGKLITCETVTRRVSQSLLMEKSTI